MEQGALRKAPPTLRLRRAGKAERFRVQGKAVISDLIFKLNVVIAKIGYGARMKIWNSDLSGETFHALKRRETSSEITASVAWNWKCMAEELKFKD